MADDEQLALPNMPSTPKAGRAGAVASVKKASDAVKSLLNLVDQLDAKLTKLEKTAKSIATSLGAASQSPGGGTGTMGIGSSGTSLMPTSISRVPHTLAYKSPSSPLPLIPTGPPNGFQTWTQQIAAMPGSSANPARFSSTSQKKYGPGNGQNFMSGSGGGSSFVGEKFNNAEAFFLPQLIGKVAGNVSGFAGKAYDDNILANRFAVGTSAATGNFGGYQTGMYRRMAQATFGGAYNAQDRQQGLGTLEQQFSTSSIFGGGTGRGGGGSLVGQTVGLSQSVAGLGLAGAAGAQTALNRPRVVNNLRAYGITARDSSGGVNYQRVANGVLDRIFGKNAKLTPDQVAYSFEPGNGAYYDLSNMGFDENTIQIIKRLAMGRAQAGWSGGVDLSQTDAGKRWRSKAGLTDNVTKNQLNRSGESALMSSRTTGGAVAGIDATNSTMSKLGNAFDQLAGAIQPIITGFSALGGALGTLPGSPGSSQSGIGSSVLHGAAGTASLGMQYLLLKNLAGGAGPALSGLGPAAMSGLGIGGAAALGVGAAGAVGGVAGGVGSNYLLNKAGVHNKWAHVGGGALAGAGTGAAVGAGIGAFFGGVGAAPGAVIGGAIGGIGGAVTGLFADGGVVPGSHNNDTVGIRATPGEVVVPRHTVNKHGGASELMRKLGFSGAGRDGDGYASGGEVVGFAEKQLGKPYKWGGNNPKTSFDCSGLVQWSYQQAGIRLPRTAHEQQKVGKSVDPGNVQAGDLLFIGNPAHHVMMSIGGGRVIQAPHTGDVVKENSYAATKATNIRRVIGGGGTSSVGAGSTTGGDAGDTGAAGAPSAPSYFAERFNTGLAMTTYLGTARGTATGGGAAATGAAPTSPTGNAALAKRLAAQRGWTGGQWNDLYALWQQESGFSTTAGNPAHAYGIPQALPGSKMASKGSDWRTNPSTQILWGLDYISSRYGNPTKAEEHKHATDSRRGSNDKNAQPGGWYSQGAWETKDEIARLHQGEMVMPAKAAEAMRQVMREQSTGKGGSSSGAQVNIYVTLANASDAEARRLANRVKQEIVGDHSMARVASS